MTVPSVLMFTDTLTDPAGRYSSAWLYDVDPYDQPHGDELRAIHTQQRLARIDAELERERAA